MKEVEAEQHGSSVVVVWTVFIVTVIFLITGIIYMYLRPGLSALGRG
ncbi:MAG: hypothetical protein ACKVU1_09590 [bacterium]